MVIKRLSGFNLIELMIVITIIAVLVAIAYPSYQSQIRKAKRAEMKVMMQDIASNIQRYKVAHFSVIGATASNLGINETYPTQGGALYNVTLTPVDNEKLLTSESWQLTATPITGTNQASDGTLMINSKGQKCWDEVIICTLSSTSNWDGK